MSSLTCGLGKWFRTWFNKQDSNVQADLPSMDVAPDNQVFSMGATVRNPNWRNGLGLSNYKT